MIYLSGHVLFKNVRFVPVKIQVFVKVDCLIIFTKIRMQTKHWTVKCDAKNSIQLYILNNS